MPLTAAAGSISLAVDNLRVTLADSAAFRTWSGTSTQAAALARIYYESLPPPTDKNEHTLVELTALRPCALVWTEPTSGFTLRHDSQGSSFGYNESGVMMIRFLQTVDPAIVADAAEIARRFLNAIGTILDELAASAGVAGYIASEELELEFGPYRGEVDERATQGDYIGCDVKVTWGT